MVKEFENLREDEIDVLMKAPVYVAILIAGADGNIDSSERKEAIDIAHSKQVRAREQLIEYYKAVGIEFEQSFNRLIDELPDEAEERNKLINAELRKLNFIFPKIDKNFTIKLYASLKELAKRIGEASGGLLGYLSVSYEEAKLIELKAIHDPSK
ncbi:MAG: hypothetical protein RIA69_04260 [Cyclobacteriaceae bacterium]